MTAKIHMHRVVCTDSAATLRLYVRLLVVRQSCGSYALYFSLLAARGCQIDDYVDTVARQRTCEQWLDGRRRTKGRDHL